MESKADYIQRLQHGLESMHNCVAAHVESVRVSEVFRGNTTWEGTVEVFSITGRSDATHAYCWSHLQGMHDRRTDFVALLAVPPVDSPLAAVRAWIVSDVNKRN